MWSLQKWGFVRIYLEIHLINLHNLVLLLQRNTSYSSQIKQLSIRHSWRRETFSIRPLAWPPVTRRCYCSNKLNITSVHWQMPQASSGVTRRWGYTPPPLKTKHTHTHTHKNDLSQRSPAPPWPTKNSLLTLPRPLRKQMNLKIEK